MLKVELHAHIDADPLDAVPHSARELIDRASALGYHALAITPHNRYFDPADDLEYARTRGLLLIGGIERTIAHAHVLLVNFPPACADVRTLDDVAALKREWPNGLVVAPHACFPTSSALGVKTLDRYAHVFDAVEVNAMFTRQIDFNAAAVRWAARHGKPLVGDGDVHLLAQLGTTYSLVDAHPEADAICAAIKAGRVRVQSEPLSLARAATHFSRMALIGLIGRAQRLLGVRPRP